MQMEVLRSRMWNRRTRLGLLIGVASVFSAVLCFVPRVPLGLGYHDFADRRLVFDIPHSFDVLSNIPFVLVGIWGMALSLRMPNNASFVESRERIPYFVFFAGVALTGVGSGYYHLAPGNSRLIWDLLPMTFSFTSVVDAVIVERISVRAGLWMLLPLIALGVASAVYWYLGELRGRGDLRFYLFVQFFPALAISMMIALLPPRYTRTNDLLLAFIFYMLAKLFELLDKQIYSLGGIVSGHTLKHLTAALSCYWILRMLKLRCAVGSVAEGGAGPSGMARTAPTC
jgi:hypothetical protein